jgi:CspA family cold shock protein
MSTETPTLVTTSDRLIGRVKWFNNKAGYGFITVTDGHRSGRDIFVHHSTIKVLSEQYKYLVQGEYVEFKIDNTPSGTHEYQAADVSGINGGKLMCETRREFREARTNYKTTSPNESTPSFIEPKSVRPPRKNGNGPRDSKSEGWVLSSKKGPRNTKKDTVVSEN